MSAKKKALTMGGMFLLGIIGGAVLMYNDSVYHSINDALGRGATQNSIGSTQDITTVNINTMDLEAALMAVQANRASLLDAQLKDQINSLQQKNDQIAKLNNVLNVAGSQLASIPSGTEASNPVTASNELKEAMTNAGLQTQPPQSKEELERLQQQLKSQIDAQANSQQMDMLRIQSLSNKRNESFDIMTNFVKKMQDSRNSVIGNMR